MNTVILWITYNEDDWKPIECTNVAEAFEVLRKDSSVYMYKITKEL